MSRQYEAGFKAKVAMEAERRGAERLEDSKDLGEKVLEFINKHRWRRDKMTIIPMFMTSWLYYSSRVKLDGGKIEAS